MDTFLKILRKIGLKKFPSSSQKKEKKEKLRRTRIFFSISSDSRRTTDLLSRRDISHQVRLAIAAKRFSKKPCKCRAAI